jgi:glucose dehydrogenase
LATTTAFALPASSTVVRPVITFTLTTAQLPQGDYRIFGYSRVTNAYATNAGVLSVNFGLPASPSTETVIQNYNTPIDYTFTSRNLYHCFRNYVAGVFHVNVIGSQQNLITPLFYSVNDYANIFTQASTSGALIVPAVAGGTVVGNWSSLSVNNSENLYILLPNYSIIVYNLTGWSGTIYLNAKNNTNNPIIVAPTTISAGSSCKIYFDEVELIKY